MLPPAAAKLAPPSPADGRAGGSAVERMPAPSQTLSLLGWRARMDGFRSSRTGCVLDARVVAREAPRFRKWHVVLACVHPCQVPV